MMDLPCFLCGQPVIGLQGQDYDWNTTLLHLDREQDQHAERQSAFGPCHLLCLVQSEWGGFWVQRFLERHGAVPGYSSADGWRMLPGDREIIVIHDDGWLAAVPDRSVRLAEPHAGGMRMPIVERRYEHLRRFPHVVAPIQAAFAQGHEYLLTSLIDALGIRVHLTTPQALDRAVLRPQPRTSRRGGGSRNAFTLAVILSYDVWLPSEVFERLRPLVPNAVSQDADRLWQALEAVDLAQAVALLSRGVSPDAAGESGKTPLMFAAGEGYLDLVRVLLSYGADINRRSPATGGTALRDAAIQDDAIIVRLLLDQGANPDTKDDLGETALSIAQDMDFVEIVNILQKANAH